jgi:hypothetical protein
VRASGSAGGAAVRAGGGGGSGGAVRAGGTAVGAAVRAGGGGGGAVRAGGSAAGSAGAGAFIHESPYSLAGTKEESPYAIATKPVVSRQEIEDAYDMPSAIVANDPTAAGASAPPITVLSACIRHNLNSHPNDDVDSHMH